MSKQKYAGLPAAVKRAGEAADAAIASLNNPQPDPPEPAPEPAPGGDGADPPNPEPGAAVADPPPVDPPEPSNDPPPGGDTVARAEYDRLQEAHSTLQSKYNAEVPRLARELREAKEANAELVRKVAELSTPRQPTPTKVTASDPAAIAKSLGLTDDDLEALGPRALTVVHKIVQAVASTTAKEAIEPVAESLQSDRERDFWFAFVGTSDRPGLVPDAPELDKLPEFAAYMAEVDPASGQVRQDLLEQAFEKLDAKRCAHFYLDFKQRTGRVTPAPAAAPPQPDSAPKKDPASRVAPGSGAARGAPAPKPKRTFKDSEVKAFYRDKAQGKWRGREAEAAATEREILEAQRDNRVTPG